MSTDFTEVVRHAAQFKQRVQQAKRELGNVDFEWYPHDTLTALGIWTSFSRGQTDSC